MADKNERKGEVLLCKLREAYAHAYSIDKELRDLLESTLEKALSDHPARLEIVMVSGLDEGRDWITVTLTFRYAVRAIEQVPVQAQIRTTVGTLFPQGWLEDPIQNDHKTITISVDKRDIL